MAANETELSRGAVPLIQPTLVTIFLCLAGTVIGGCNALVIGTLRTTERLKTRANMYLLSLAASDLMVGLVLVALGLYFSLGGWTAPQKCSFFNVVAIALDRYLYLLHPFHYHRLVTERRVKGAIGGLWTAAGGVTLVPVVAGGSHRVGAATECRLADVVPDWYRCYFFSAVFLSACAVTCVAYARIGWLSHRVAARVVSRPSLPAVGPAPVRNPPSLVLARLEAEGPSTAGRVTGEKSFFDAGLTVEKERPLERSDVFGPSNASEAFERSFVAERELEMKRTRVRRPSAVRVACRESVVVGLAATRGACRKALGVEAAATKACETLLDEEQPTQAAYDASYNNTGTAIVSVSATLFLNPEHLLYVDRETRKHLNLHRLSTGRFPVVNMMGVENAASTLLSRAVSDTLSPLKQSRQNKPHLASVIRTNTVDSLYLNRFQCPLQNRERFKRGSTVPVGRAHLKAVKLFAVLFGFLLAFWTPWVCLEFDLNFFGGDRRLVLAGLIMGLMNSAVNAFVYPALDKDFRNAVKKRLCRGWEGPLGF